MRKRNYRTQIESVVEDSQEFERSFSRALTACLTFPQTRSAEAHVIVSRMLLRLEWSVKDRLRWTSSRSLSSLARRSFFTKRREPSAKFIFICR